jgi:hypothetical protein
MTQTSVVTATFLDSRYTAGAFVFEREDERRPWSSIVYTIIDSRGDTIQIDSWREPIPSDHETDEELEERANSAYDALTGREVALREEFVDWIDRTKTEFP